MTKQRGISALCSVHQRLALAKTVHARLAGCTACYAWLPYDLLDPIGKVLVPPADESRGSQGLWQPEHLDLDRPDLAMVRASYPVNRLRDPEARPLRASVQDLGDGTRDGVLAPVVVEEEYTALMAVALRSLPGGVGSK